MSGAKPGYVSAFTFHIKPDDFDGLCREATLILQRKGPAIAGLIESIIMGNDEKTEMLILSQWSSRESWSAAQWDEDVAQAVAAFVETSTSFEVHTFNPVTVIRTAP